MSKTRILYVAHGHATIRAGGAEQHAYELYQAMKGSDEFAPFLLARTGEPEYRPVPGSLFRAIGDDGTQVLFYTEGMDYFFHTQRDKGILTTHLRDFLRAYEPEVVHFQHTIHIGIDTIRVVRNTLPDSAVVMTLHEYVYICNAAGLMVEKGTHKPCTQATVARCHRCFPDIEPRDFLLRERFLKSHLNLVDRFIAPSHFLAERYKEWGLPERKIVHIDYGRPTREPLPPRAMTNGEARSRFGYFGQLSSHKGILELLEAVSRLGERGGTFGQLFVNGANLETQPAEFKQSFRDSLDACNGAVRDLGSYTHSEITERMALIDWVVVPSTWWENSPLVIQEAFLHGRPVICADIGGMKEKVLDGINGLHFRAGDVHSLAETLWRAANTPGLWERLRDGIPRVYSMDDSVAAHSRLYRAVLDERRVAQRDSARE